MTPEERNKDDISNIPQSLSEIEKNTHPHRNVVKVENIYKSFGIKKVLKNCSFEIKRGELLAVIGPEGHGKSTMAKIVSGLIAPTNGMVTIRGVKAGRMTNSIVSYQPDIPFFKYDNTVSEILNLYSRFFRDFSYKKAYLLLKHFDISKRTRLENLSTTALFIVQVILVSSRRASLYIFDDPIVHCDPKYREEIINMIDRCRKYGAILLLTQTAQGIDDIADKAAFLRRGEICGDIYNADQFEKVFGQISLADAYKEVFKNA